jgi:chromosome segregation ATPase
MANYSRKPVAIENRGFGKYRVVNKDGRELSRFTGKYAIAEAKAAELKVPIVQPGQAMPEPAFKSGAAAARDALQAATDALQAATADNATLAEQNVRLREQLDEAEALNKQQAVTIAETLATLEKLKGDILEVGQKCDQYKRWWTEERDRLKKAEERADADAGDAAQARLERQGLERRLASMEADMQRERGYIEGLLDGRHPERPRLPWEPNIIREERVGDISMRDMTQRWNEGGGY